MPLIRIHSKLDCEAKKLQDSPSNATATESLVKLILHDSCCNWNCSNPTQRSSICGGLYRGDQCFGDVTTVVLKVSIGLAALVSGVVLAKGKM